MAKQIFGVSPASVVLRVKLMNSSVTTGAGLTGLTNTSSGLIISTIKIGESTATVYTSAASNIETIATLGTYAAPSSNKCRFKEVDATNHKGIYELQFADARFQTTDALIISISGATNLAEADFEIICKNLATDVKMINAVATTSVTTINANQGTTQPVNFTGTAGSALVKGDTVDIAGAAVSTTTAQIGVNAVQINAVATTSVTAVNAKIGTTADIGFTGANVNAEAKVTAAPTDMALNSTVAKEATVAALNNVSSADVNAACDTAISDAALATAASIAALNDVSSGDVQTAAAAAITAASLATSAEISALNDISTGEAQTAAAAAITAAALATSAEITALNDVSTGEVQTAAAAAITAASLATSAEISALNDISPAEVNAEVVDALLTDTMAEPSAANPSNTPSIGAAVNHLYRAVIKDKVTATATTETVYMANGTTPRFTKAISDDGTTTTKGASA